MAFAGRDRNAIEHGETAIRLSPMDPEMAMFFGGIAVAHYTASRYDEALHYSDELLRMRPGFQGAQRLRCAALAQLGMIAEARQFLAQVMIGQPKLPCNGSGKACPIRLLRPWNVSSKACGRPAGGTQRPDRSIALSYRHASVR
jgi:tetratricopeptide (TPR) repeat protein